MEVMNTDLTQMITMLCLLSIAVERVNAIFLGVAEIDKRITNPKFNSAAKQLCAAAFGAIIFALNKDAHVMFGPYFSGWGGALVVGFMASGGSGFWNSILKLVMATTTRVAATTPAQPVIDNKDLPK
jgi:hypothetical protein